jgi:hypothetical protein
LFPAAGTLINKEQLPGVIPPGLPIERIHAKLVGEMLANTASKEGLGPGLPADFEEPTPAPRLPIPEQTEQSPLSNKSNAPTTDSMALRAVIDLAAAEAGIFVRSVSQISELGPIADGVDGNMSVDESIIMELLNEVTAALVAIEAVLTRQGEAVH